MKNISHLDIIKDRYSNNSKISFTQYPPNLLVERYLSKIMSLSDIKNKTILEIGAGCSHYTPIFMTYGCDKYYANDLISDRLKVSSVNDSRYFELPGNFLEISIPENVDIIFSCLTMMFVMPLLDDFITKIRDSLKDDGYFISMDPNYFSPISIFRRFTDFRPNPARLFSPIAYAKTFERHGFTVERLVPFSAKTSIATDSWLLGTNFWLKVKKK